MQQDNEKTIAELEKKFPENKKIVRVLMWISILTAFLALGLSVNFGNWYMLLYLPGLCLVICCVMYDSRISKKINIVRGYYIEDRIKYFVDSRGKVTHKVIGKVVFDE